MTVKLYVAMVQFVLFVRLNRVISSAKVECCMKQQADMYLLVKQTLSLYNIAPSVMIRSKHEWANVAQFVDGVN